MTHTVRPGESLYSIGQYYNVNWMEIARANGITAPYTIYVGQVLTIPMSTPMPMPMQQHVVQQGETLSSIAAQYGTTWQAIAQLNNIKDPNVIFPGMVLKIPR